MPIVPAKCPECGGLVEVNNEKRAGLCQHCGQLFVVEDAIQTFNTYYQTTNNYNTTHNYGDGAVVNIYEDKSKDFVIEAGVLKEYHGESIDVVIPDNVTEINKTAFSYKSIRSIAIPASIETIEEGAFLGCNKLEKISISDNFKWFSRILFLNIKNINIEDDSKCFVLEDGILYDNLKSKIIFADKTIENAIVPNTVNAIGERAFFRCNMLKSIQLNNGLRIIESAAFEHCSKLIEITLPNSVQEIGSHAFDNCNSLSKVILSKLITTVPISCFAHCSSLVDVNLRKSITKISYFAFYDCMNLQEITIPESTRIIEDEAFKGCEKLSNVILNSLNISFGKDALSTKLKEKAIRNFQVKDNLKNTEKLNSIIKDMQKREALGYGATIEEATLNAKNNLNAPIGIKVSLQIIQLPSKKLFSKKDAIVKAFVSG